MLAYYQHCEATMRAVEADKVKAAMRPVKAMYGERNVSEFNPLAFKAVRKLLVDSGLAISTIRDRMGIIRRMVAYGVEHAMAPADALQRIEAVGGLRSGRDGVKPSKKIKPAPAEHIQAILPHVNETIRAMVQVQSLTGMRPGEVWRMTTGQIDRTGDAFGNWLYSPVRHKTVDLGHDRIIQLGPHCQEVLKPWLRADPDAISFRRSRRRHATTNNNVRLDARRSIRRPENRGVRSAGPNDRHGRCTTRTRTRRRSRAVNDRAKVPVFRPNQIRHTLATRVQA